MVDKPFLFFGKRTLSKVDLKEQQLKHLETRISELKKEQENLKSESARIIVETEKKVIAAEKEEKTLKALRTAVATHSGHIDNKEAELREKENLLNKEAARLQKLKQEEAGLREETARLGKIYDEKTSAVNRFKSEVADAKREQEKLKSESARIIVETEKKVIAGEKEEKTLKALRTAVATHSGHVDKKESELRDVEKSLSKREGALANETTRIQKMRAEEIALHEEISSMGKIYDEKNSALNGLKKEIANFVKELAGLQQRRAENARMEENIRNLVLKERQVRQEMSKMEKRVADGANMLSKIQEDRARNETRLKELSAFIGQAAVMKKQLESETEAHQKTILNAKRELADMEADIKDVMKIKEQLQQKGAFLGKRERQAEEQEQRIDRKKSELERLHANASAAEKARQEVIVLVEEKKHILDDLKSAIAQNSQIIQELHERETSAKKAERDLQIAQREAEKKLKLVESKDQELMGREAAFVEHEKALKEASRMLGQDKKVFMEEVNVRKAEFLLIQQEWDKKFAALSDEKKELRIEKTDVRRLVDSDVLALKEKEDELVQTIEMLERDKKKLQDEETAIIRRVRELEKEQAVVEREKSALDAKDKKVVGGERIIQKGMKYLEIEKRKVEQAKDVVFRSREFKRILPQMEQRYNELQKAVRKLEARAIGLGTKPSESRLFKAREKDLDLKEKGVEMGVRKLIERESEVEALEQRKERAFSEYLREEVERAQVGKPGRELVNPEIHAMLDDAREKVMQGDLDAAIRLVSQVEYLIDRLQNPEQKRLLMYDIRDLKASIKLASLT